MAKIIVNGDGSGESARDRYWRDVGDTETVIELKLAYVRYLSDVSTIDQTFKIAVGFDLEWEATENDRKEWAKSPKDYVPELVPNFEVPNAKEFSVERREQANGNPFYINEETGKNFLRAFCEATCLQSYNLRAFPFDVQDLRVIVDMTFNLKEKMMFAPNPDKDATMVVLNRQFCALPEFDPRRVSLEFATRDDCWAQLVFRFQVARRFEGQVYRVAFPCFLLTIVTGAAFASDLEEAFEDRVAYLITLILTFVAFAFVISQQLPQVAYLTILDKYNLSCFSMVIVLLVSVSILKNTTGISPDRKGELDTYLFYAFSVVLLLMNIYFAFVSYLARAKEVKKFNMNARQLEKINFNANTDSPLTVSPANMELSSAYDTDGDAYISYSSASFAMQPLIGMFELFEYEEESI